MASPLTKKEFQIIAATTLGYYLVRDVVKRKWPRRIAQTAVVAGGVAALAPEQWEALSKKERKQIRKGLEEVREQASAGELAPVAAAVATPVVILGAGAWVQGKTDAAGAAFVSGTVGRLPLIGGLFRALPSTTFGAAQLGVVYLVNERLLKSE